MSDNDDDTSLIGLAFELQRNSLELGQRTISRTLDARREIDKRLVSGLQRQADTQENALEFTRRTIDDLLESVGENADVQDRIEDIRQSVNDGFDEIIERQGQLVADVGERYDPDNREFDPLDEAVLSTLDDQLSFLLEANQSLESQTVEAFERIVDEFEDLVDVISEETEEVGAEFETQVDRFGDELEDQLDSFEQRFDNRMDRIRTLRGRVQDLQDEVEEELEDTTDDPAVTADE